MGEINRQQVLIFASLDQPAGLFLAAVEGKFHLIGYVDSRAPKRGGKEELSH
jgi:hypothetical protein